MRRVASNETQEARREAKAASRAESRSRQQARRARAGERDKELLAAYDRYRATTKRIWDEWRAAE